MRSKRAFNNIQQQGFVPVDLARDTIANDRFLTGTEKNDTINILNLGHGLSGNGLKGTMSTRDVVGGALGYGVGGVSAKLLGTVIGGTFGGIKPKTLDKLKNMGSIAGMLRGTGIWQ